MVRWLLLLPLLLGCGCVGVDDVEPVPAPADVRMCAPLGRIEVRVGGEWRELVLPEEGK